LQAQQLKAEKAALQLAEAEKDKTIAALEADLARYASPPATPASTGPGVGLGGFRGLSVATKSWVDASTNNNAPPPGATSSAGGGGGGAEEGPGPASDEYTRKLEKAVRLLRERASKAEAKAALLAAMQDPLPSATIGGSKPAPAPAPARRPPSSSSNSSAAVARPLEGNVGGSTRAEIEMLLSDDLMYQVGTLTAQNKALANELKEARKQGAERAAKVRVTTVVQCGVW